MIQIKTGCICVDGVFKDCRSGPFSLPEEQEQRLVQAGVAEYAEFIASCYSIPTGPVHMDKESLEAMSMTELKDLAKQYDIDTSKMKKKCNIVTAFLDIGACEESILSEDDPEDTLELSAEDPV